MADGLRLAKMISSLSRNRNPHIPTPDALADAAVNLIDVVPQGMGVGLVACSMEIFLRRLVEPSPGAVCVWAILAAGLMALPLD